MEQVESESSRQGEMNLHTRTEHPNQSRKDANGRGLPYICSPQ
jgi:hypothetical protein